MDDLSRLPPAVRTLQPLLGGLGQRIGAWQDNKGYLEQRIQDSVQPWQSVSKLSDQLGVDFREADWLSAPDAHHVVKALQELSDALQVAQGGGAELSEDLVLLVCGRLDRYFFSFSQRVEATVAGVALDSRDAQAFRVLLSAMRASASQRLMSDQTRMLAQQAQEARDLADSASFQAGEASEVARKAAGLTGALTLTAQYASLAKAEAKAGSWFRGFAIGLVILDIVLALLLHLVYQISSLGQSIQALSILAGVAGLAGYLARQAHQHRTLAIWAQSIEVQLLTLDAYLEALEDRGTRDELRASFGVRVFGPAPKMKGEPGVTISSTLADKLVDALGKRVG